ncbi:type I polyketide synthase [Thermomonospora sp. CIF 1]|uniref:type I polyketide synthase n=1 Tax=Thermomonospora sp. CIF 1 TaxID=1916083 RepID=UPI000CA65F49|nr:type I polyketide synthase [Thermomonospora sp. CIF 1]PKK13491.1 MAG: polyketide synthase [Thermomonospora sp. CIF 1]
MTAGTRAPRGEQEAIAIVSMGCRYPGGVRSPEDLWRLVAEGVDATSGFPDNRGWRPEDLAGGRAGTDRGGFLHDADQFDAKFFGISPREAEGMDPQQRVLLEVAWETFERAGMDRDGLAGSNTGVFVGAMAQEYGPRLHEDNQGAGGYRITGSTPSVASGRIAYYFGLRGPAITVDTACSSSLVAVHLAVQALRQGECDLALAGGVAVMATPGMFVDFHRQGGLSPDGRCRAFSDDANGTAWSEGAGLLLLERLPDALARGHRIHALIRGSATNSDGASNGLTAPSGPAQEEVIRRALRSCGLAPHDVDAVEAHGTGTELGDPIEARALAAVYGKDRDAEHPLWLGSLKSNLGHSQAAAGVGGVIKMVQAMKAGTLPATLHVSRPTRHVDWERSGLALLTEARPWPRRDGRPRRAGVSSFGISGTNAHLVLEEAPPVPEQDDEPAAAGPLVWSLSAPTPESLRTQARALAGFLESRPQAAPEDVARTLRAKTRFPHRGVVIADTRDDLTAGLATLASGGPASPPTGRYQSPTVLRGEARPDEAGPVFVFPGQGSQWREMGLALLEESRVFRESMLACERELAGLCGWRLTEELRGDSFDRVDVVQPALFAVMVSLARLWESVGVRPAAVVGHSQGEIAAAHVAGALSLADACRVVALRSRALRSLAGTGGMVSVPLGVEATQRLLNTVDGVSVAAINAPTATVVAGSTDGLEDLLAVCERQGVEARRIEVDYASHTHAMKALKDTLLEELAGVSPRPPQVPLHSTLTGTVIDDASMDAAYWYDNLRSTVRFDPVIRQLIDRGHRVFIEVSPHPVLTYGVQEICEEMGVRGTVVGTLRRDGGGLGQFLMSAAAPAGAAGPVDLTAVQPPGRQIDLPTFQFDRSRYWVTAPSGGTGGASGTAGGAFVTGRTDLPSGQTVLTARIDPQIHRWLPDHAVRDTALVPATVFLSLLTEAGERIGRPVVAELALSAPLPLPDQGTAELRIVCKAADAAGRVPLTVHSRRPDGGWIEHATAVLAARGGEQGQGIEQWPPADASRVDLTDAYRRLSGRGYRYGPAFTGLRAMWLRGNEIFSEVTLPDEVGGPGDFATAHPALLDAALHAAVLQSGTRLVVPFAWRDVALAPTRARTLRVRAVTEAGRLSLSCCDEEGRVVGSVGELELRPPADPDEEGTTLELAWEPMPQEEEGPSAEWATLASPGLGARRDYPDLESLPDPAPAVVAAALAADGHDLPESAEELAVAATDLLQGWLADRRSADTRLALVTRGALSITDREPVPGLASSVVTGLVRSAQSEHPGTFALVDIDDNPASLQALPRALSCDEPEVAIRAGRLYRPRLRPLHDDGLRPPEGERFWRLDVTSKGTLENLALIPHPEAAAPLGPRQVRIEVRAAGLNFRDVTVGLGLVPTEKTMGSEGAGVVTEVGSEVTGFAVGDRVFGMFERSLGPVAVADERMIRHLPEGWSYAQAASVPIVFITAYQCLVDVAGIRPGESVLIHTATGGVGLAAIQLARHLGAEVFATAGPGKHAMLREWGLPDDHIASSRSLDFAERFRAVTGGRGVDVVLNSLSGKAIDASLGLLAEGGRFAEMGKTDLRDVARTEAEYPGITYRTYNILGQHPDRIGEVLAELVALFEAGVLTHLPLRTWDVRQGKTPLRMLSRAKHRGKLVLTMPRSFDPDRPVLITGGTGGLGAVLARHLAAAHGARRLVLVSRRGPAAEGAAELRAELAGLGAEVSVIACDVTDENALAKVIAEHEPGSVFHTAGMLGDGLISQLTPARLRAVLRPKVTGAWNLHRLTEHLDLSAFVLFSSAIGVLGGPGQANYAAANAFLDALAQYRRARGLEATSLAWGLWREATGMTGHLSQTDTAALSRIGLAPMETRHGLRLLDQSLGSARSLLVPLRPADTGLLNPGSRAAALLNGLREDASARRPAPAAPPAVRPAADAPADPASRRPTAEDLLQLVRTHAAEVLGYGDPSTVGPQDSFKSLGFDSLLSVDLRNRLNAATGLRLPAGAVLDHPTPQKLVEFMITRLDGHDAAVLR